MKRKPQTTSFWTGRLPHWEVEEGRYFITISLAGAIPAAGRRRLQTLAEEFTSVKRNDEPKWIQLHRSIFREMERWLDQVGRHAELQHQDVAEMVVEAIEHRRDRGDWNLFEYVVMPTHIHLFCELLAKDLKTVCVDFKRWTGHQAAKILGTEAERFWQREWFDHWSRSDEEDERIAAYIRQNPVKAGLVDDYLDWKYGSWSTSRLPGGTWRRRRIRD